MDKRLVPFLFLTLPKLCRADEYASAPTVNSLAETNSSIPFYARVAYAHPVTMRYQQVCNASVFTNIDPAFVYIPYLTFFVGNRSQRNSTLTNFQVNLSTTQKSADGLAPTFSANVGPDDTVVFGPGSFTFSAGGPHGSQPLPLDRPFRYSARQGNLLIDIRIFNGDGAFDETNPEPAQDAFASPSDEVSRIWTPDVNAITATNADTTGLSIVFEFSPVPSLTATFYPVWSDVVSLTNIVKIGWPSLPPGFVLQKSDHLGPGALWHSVTNQVEGTPPGPVWIKFPAKSAGPSGFFRLVMPSGP
jgi:hypothetical protein